MGLSSQAGLHPTITDSAHDYLSGAGRYYHLKWLCERNFSAHPLFSAINYNKMKTAGQGNYHFFARKCVFLQQGPAFSIINNKKDSKGAGNQDRY